MDTAPSHPENVAPVGQLASEQVGTQSRRLRRSRQDRVLAGVCGGLGRYLDLDPVVIRILTVALIFTGVGRRQARPVPGVQGRRQSSSLDVSTVQHSSP